MKRSIRPEPSAGEAARLGEELRDARLTLGLSIEDIAASLRIRRPYLVALEEGRVRELPAPAYAVGFVRTYARALGLDDDAMVRRFRDASGPVVQRKTDLIFPEPVPERGVPAGAVILVGAVLAIGGYLGWYQWSGSGARTVDAVPPLPARLEQALVTPREPSSPAPIAPPEAMAAVAPALPVAALPPAAPGQAPAAAAPTPAPAATNGRPVAPPTATPAAAPPLPESRVILRAKAESWIQVRDTKSGTVILNRVLRPGESYAVPARDGLLLNTGNAGGLDIVVDGQVAPGLGGAQSVRRDVPLEPDRLRSGQGPTVAAPRPAAQ